MPPTALAITAIPVLDTSAYVSGDVLSGTLMRFDDVVSTVGGLGTIIGLKIIDSDLQSQAGELWLFDAPVVLPAANAAWSISDTDAQHLVCRPIVFSTYYASGLNSISGVEVGIAFKASGTSLYGVLVTRGTPTYTASGLTVTLTVADGALAASGFGSAAQGNVAIDAPVTANPLLVGGRASAAAPTAVSADGDAQALWLNKNGAVVISVQATALGNADGQNQPAVLGDASSNARPLGTGPFLFNGGTTWDRQRNNHEIVLLASAARTTTQTLTLTNYNARAAYIVIDITTYTSGGITPAVKMTDTNSGKNIAISGAITKLQSAATFTYFFGLGTPVAAGGVTLVSGFPLPRLGQLVLTVDDATSITYSCAINYIV